MNEENNSKTTNEDCQNIIAKITAEDTQTDRRNFIRAACASIDAHVSEIYHSIPDHEISKLEPHEILAIGEKTISINDSGDVKLRQLKAPTKTRIIFKYKILSKILNGLNIAIDITIIKNIEKLLNDRDRITHPNISNSMIISDEDLVNAMKLHIYIVQNHTKILKSIVDSYKAENERLDNIIKSYRK